MTSKPRSLRTLAELLTPQPPTMAQIEVQFLDLTLIARKAADGAGVPLPVLQRGFVYPSLIGARCQYWAFTTTEVLS